jgi:hypothetical protein
MQVITHDVMSGTTQTTRHVRTHFAQTYHCNLQDNSPF